MLRKSLFGLLLFSWAAMGITLDEARTQGMVGETLSGYIAPVKQSAEAQELVERINRGRLAEYRTLAQRNNLTTADVARIAGEKLVNRAPPGEFVRGINGQWLKKSP